MKKLVVVCGLGCAVAGLGFGTPGIERAYAQAEEGEDIIVTARKREESLQRIPVAVTAFSGADLTRQGIQTPGDLSRQVPSLATLQSQATSNNLILSLRGQVASDIIMTVDQAVGVYVDGVNIPRTYGLQSGFVDIERVEVLKGPQGTLYGRNTTGGAINIISKAADFNGVHGYVGGEAGNYSDWKVFGAVNVPIVADKLATRLVYQRWKRDGYGESRITGQDIGGDKDQHYFRGTLLFTPTDKVSIEVKGDWTRIRENGQLTPLRFYVPQDGTDFQAAYELGLDPFSPLARATAQSFIQNIAALGNADIFTSDNNALLKEDIDRHSISGTVTFDLADNVVLKSLTAYHRLREDRQTDIDGTRFHILEIGESTANIGPNFFPDMDFVDAKFFSQEFNLSGSAMDDRFEWLGGVYYSNENGADATVNNFRLDQTRLASASTLLAPGTPFVINFNQGFDIQNTSWSVYSQNEYHFTEQLSLTFGGRYTEERKGITFAGRRFDPSTGLYSCSTGIAGTFTNPASCFVNREATFTGFSWLASVNYQVTEDMLLYVKTGRGFRGGGFNLRVPAADPFKPETARDIELGMKADFLDGRLRTNLAAYTTKYANKQESIIVPFGLTPQFLVQNAATANIKGVELETSVRPTDGLSLRGTVTYLHGKYNSFPGALSVNNVPVNASGERFGLPSWNYSLSGRYELPVFQGVFGLQADWSWTSKGQPADRLVDPALPAALVNEFVCAIGTCQNARGSYGLLNVRADYEIEDWGVTLSAFSTNVLNKEYQIAGLARSGLGGVQTGVTMEPRMYGFQIKKSFGAGE